MRKWVTGIPEDLFDDRARVITLVWNKDDKVEIEAARRSFEEHVEKGLIAFIEESDGRKVRVFRFEPKYQKVTFARLVEGG
ncbi:MAG: hypothetical protein QG670_2879 [Thermoproteota archaeon]|nr:hypothetical protein [Thermoproteota archaeon]